MDKERMYPISGAVNFFSACYTVKTLSNAIHDIRLQFTNEIWQFDPGKKKLFNIKFKFRTLFFH